MKTQMHDYMQNIIEAIKFYTNKLLRKSVANWEQNDSEALDYVKGRTHWDDTERVAFITEQTITFPAGETYSSYKCLDQEEVAQLLVDGDICYVTFDGVEYECVLSYDGQWYELGNSALWDDDTTETGEPFAFDSAEGMIVRAAAYDRTITFKAEKAVAVTHPLDPKYIPDSIARVSDVESALSDSSTAVNEQLDSLRTEITEDLEEKVNVFQGTENTDTMLTVDEEGYVTLTPIPDEMDAITLLAERGIVEPATTAAGNVYTNKNGDVYTL